MSRVFISYASRDVDRAHAVRGLLESRGHTVWIDKRDLVAGSRYGQELLKAIREADAVIVLWTRTSVESAYVQDEAARARDGDKLVPVLLEDVELPVGFGSLNHVDLRAWQGGEPDAECERLLRSLDRDAPPSPPRGDEAIPRQRPQRRDRRRSRTPLLAALGFVAFLVGVHLIRSAGGPTEPSATIWRSAGGGGEWAPLVEGDSITRGDHLRIDFRPARESWWYVFQVDGRDQIVMHFPNDAKANPIAADTDVTLPGAGLALRVDGTRGTDRFYFLRTRNPDRSLDQFSNAFRETSGDLERSEEPLLGEGEVREATGPEVVRSLERLVHDLEQRCPSCVEIRDFDHR